MNNNKEVNVIKFYVLCNKLKDVVRSGWKAWKVTRERIESVAEHIYGVQMLALAMYKEFNYDLDIEKVIYMLSVHELEEIIIGDLTFFDISREDKRKIGKDAVIKILSNLINSEDIKMLIDEFELKETNEALFAYHCDKLECDIQAKLYDEEECVDLEDDDYKKRLGEERVQRIIDIEKTWSGAWIEHDRELFVRDNNFISVLDYIKNNKISNLKDN